MKYNYLSNKIFFVTFFSAFLKSTWNFELFEKKMTHIDFVFPKFQTPKMRLDKCLKSPVSEDPSTSKMVNGSWYCWNQHHSTFIIFIDLCQGNWVRESLSYWHAKSWDCLLTHWLLIRSIVFLTFCLLSEGPLDPKPFLFWITLSKLKQIFWYTYVNSSFTKYFYLV